jgi:hypothetical protein
MDAFTGVTAHKLVRAYYVLDPEDLQKKSTQKKNLMKKKFS